MKTIKRGEIYYADLSPVVGSEQGGIRPVIILQNDTGNCYSPTTIVVAVTSKTTKNYLPTHIRVHSSTLKSTFIHTEKKFCCYVGTNQDNRQAKNSGIYRAD